MMIDLLTDPSASLLFGLAAGVLSVIAFLPYIIDTYAGRTQPQRASWTIWSILGTIAFFSQVWENASVSLWFAGAQVSGTITVLLLSLGNAQSTMRLCRSDVMALFAAAIGLVLWYYTETAVYALFITIGISLLGGLLTLKKSYDFPNSETQLTWFLSLIAAVCAMLSVGKFDPVLLAYPAYLFTIYGLFIIANVLGRARLRVTSTV